MKYLLKSCISLLLPVALIMTSTLHAQNQPTQNQQKLPPLKQGMSYIEVIKLWGSPEEKIEKEIKRKDIWLFQNNSRVIFVNGTVASVLDNKGTNILLPENVLAEEKKALKSPPGQNPGVAVASQDVVDDILSEIMKDPSNVDGADSSGALKQGVPVVPNVINQVPPPEAIQ